MGLSDVHLCDMLWVCLMSICVICYGFDVHLCDMVLSDVRFSELPRNLI